MTDPLIAHSADRREELIVSVRGLRKRFGATTAIADVSLDLAPGQVLGFVGPNGAGKTTTLRILAGLLRADAGSGCVLGHDLMTAHGLVSERVGYMPQRLALYPELTVTQNLRFRADVYGLTDPKAAVEAALADFELGPYRHRRAAHLSGGWARRLQLAAALIHRPALVLLDEPTAGLDAASRLDVWRRILGLARAGASVVINTHDLAEAEQCSVIALFYQGCVLAIDDPAALTRDAPFEAVLVESSDKGADWVADAERLARRLLALAGVIAVLPQGHALRALIEPAAAGKLRQVAASMGARTEPTYKRLEDAAFVIAQNAAARGARAGGRA